MLIQGMVADLIRTRILDAFKPFNYTFFDSNKAFNLNIVGVRSSNVVANKFDDMMYIVYRNDKLVWEARSYVITTDPGSYYLQHPLTTPGCAGLVEDQYRGAYRIGLHHGKYEALCQLNKKVSVYRDANKDNRLDYDRQTIETGLFGINIHRSNPYSESAFVNKWSAGCQVFKRVADFKDFMSLCKKSAKKYGNSFTYTLLNESSLKDGI